MATLASGLAPFARRFFPAVGMMLFIVLSIPTSGGAAPAAMLPTFFQYVHAVIPLGNAVEAALRSALCFGGAGTLRPVLVCARGSPPESPCWAWTPSGTGTRRARAAGAARR
ncbi:hypothetical protein ACFU5B_09555 [Streptomyces murinus]|uniref:hypothetical protein n=1 Tax=Streptomyces murinus TaxID=33900 RepID=UPI00363FCD10